MSARLLILPVLLVGGALIWMWTSGAFDQIAAYAAGQQQAFQNRIAQALRGIRSGQAGAFGLLLGMCFAYGFFHAVGPGHGKVLISGYGLGRKVPVLRLSAIALASSLAQALSAILLVYGGILIFNLGRQSLVGMADDVLAPASFAAIVLIGLWLVLRGLRRMASLRAERAHDHHHHAHDHAHGEDGSACPSCGHRHGPTLAEVDQISSLREALVLIGGIALRPCTGALFVLIITWQLDIALAGIAGTIAMAIGTALVTISFGLAASGLRGGVMGALSDSPLLRIAVPVVEVTAGGLITLIAGGLLLRAIG